MDIEEVKKQLEAAGWGPTEPRWRHTAELAAYCIPGAAVLLINTHKLDKVPTRQIAHQAVAFAEEIIGTIEAEFIARDQKPPPRGKRKK